MRYRAQVWNAGSLALAVRSAVDLGLHATTPAGAALLDAAAAALLHPQRLHLLLHSPAPARGRAGGGAASSPNHEGLERRRAYGHAACSVAEVLQELHGAGRMPAAAPAVVLQAVQPALLLLPPLLPAADAPPATQHAEHGDVHELGDAPVTNLLFAVLQCSLPLTPAAAAAAPAAGAFAEPGAAAAEQQRRSSGAASLLLSARAAQAWAAGASEELLDGRVPPKQLVRLLRGPLVPLLDAAAAAAAAETPPSPTAAAGGGPGGVFRSVAAEAGASFHRSSSLLPLLGPVAEALCAALREQLPELSLPRAADVLAASGQLLAASGQLLGERPATPSSAWLAGAWGAPPPGRGGAREEERGKEGALAAAGLRQAFSELRAAAARAVTARMHELYTLPVREVGGVLSALCSSPYGGGGAPPDLPTGGGAADVVAAVGDAVAFRLQSTAPDSLVELALAVVRAVNPHRVYEGGGRRAALYLLDDLADSLIRVLGSLSARQVIALIPASAGMPGAQRRRLLHALGGALLPHVGGLQAAQVRVRARCIARMLRLPASAQGRGAWAGQGRPAVRRRQTVAATAVPASLLLQVLALLEAFGSSGVMDPEVHLALTQQLARRARDCQVIRIAACRGCIAACGVPCSVAPLTGPARPRLPGETTFPSPLINAPSVFARHKLALMQTLTRKALTFGMQASEVVGAALACHAAGCTRPAVYTPLVDALRRLGALPRASPSSAAAATPGRRRPSLISRVAGLLGGGGGGAGGGAAAAPAAPGGRRGGEEVGAVVQAAGGRHSVVALDSAPQSAAPTTKERRGREGGAGDATAAAPVDLRAAAPRALLRGEEDEGGGVRGQQLSLWQLQSLYSVLRDVGHPEAAAVQQVRKAGPAFAGRERLVESGCEACGSCGGACDDPAVRDVPVRAGLCAPLYWAQPAWRAAGTAPGPDGLLDHGHASTFIRAPPAADDDAFPRTLCCKVLCS